ncbi:MAG: enoyl-[acyl-carrier-protein] reductase [Parachlamydiaceae bacterium]
MLNIDLKGKIAFVAGVGDDQGYGWAIAKSLAEAGATLIIGTWAPMMKILMTSISSGKFDESRRLSDGSLMEFAKIYPLDAAFDTIEDVPEEIRTNKRYKELEGFTVADVAEAIARDYGKIDILIHSIANGPEVSKPLLETSRKGYLASVSNSSYSLISLLSHLGPHMNPGGAVLSLTYIASERAIPGYGGGMSSAKAALESDTRTLAWEAGRKWGIRVLTISAGVLASRAARAIGFTDQMLNYVSANAPLTKDLSASEVGDTAAFLVSPRASAITGTTLYVDNGMHAMGVAFDSPAFAQ